MGRELTKAEFKDLIGTGVRAVPAKTMDNALVALDLLGVACSYNAFRDRRYIAGEPLGNMIGQVSDDVCLLFRKICRRQLGFDPGKEATWDAVNLRCREGSFHPIMDYLQGLEWDGVPRIETWMIAYLGAPDTPLMRAISRIVLVASVRRIFEPGCKFDYMPILEGPQGIEKSTAIAVLYGHENFSDQAILGLKDKQLQEAVCGHWAHEVPELSGMRKGDVEQIKAQLSRQSDRGRPAYGRAVIEMPRQCIFWGTTNEHFYLRDLTGNRRFWGIVCGKIKIAALARDRDQLWAEAVADEALGGSIALPRKLWSAAGDEQAARTPHDPWEDILADAAERAAGMRVDTSDLDCAREPGDFEEIEGPENFTGAHEIEQRISSRFLLSVMLGISADRQTQDMAKHLARVMRGLGWTY